MNKDLLKDFVKYCEDNPEQRFWQALRNWSGQPFILTAQKIDHGDFGQDGFIGIEDTFYWENKNKEHGK